MVSRRLNLLLVGPGVFVSPAALGLTAGSVATVRPLPTPQARRPGAPGRGSPAAQDEVRP
jgi:hypothetical protein